LAITKSTLKILEQGRRLAARGQSGILEWRMAIVRRLGDGLFHSLISSPRPMHKLVLIRHGESTWNLKTASPAGPTWT
jgi:hypothetical protein